MAVENTAPVVSFHRDGQQLTLGAEGSTDDLLHLYGSTGLGLPPVSHALTERVGASGSLLRGTRYNAREIFIPLLVQKRSYAELTAARRHLYQLLAPHHGEIEIRVKDPATGTSRSIFGRYQEGLEGDFGSNFHGHWQTLGLTFICPDPWWLGQEKLLTIELGKQTKPFISTSSPFFPVVLSQSSVQDQFTLEISGDGEVFPTWVVSGPGTDLTLSNGDETLTINHTFKAGEGITIDTELRRTTPDLLSKVPLSSRFFSLRPGANQIKATMVGASPDSSITGIYREKYLEAI